MNSCEKWLSKGLRAFVQFIELNDHRLEAGGFDSRLKARLLWVQDKPKTPNILANSTFTEFVSQLVEQAPSDAPQVVA